ncbi:GPI inositol-deacylase isoform X2 [Aplysia californica]|uniref:GPI inositol-deacylase n=1 Tax=Aplysia californica TaxID=6500 RepID=A0ABM1W122_APLCA|nr:GPI inositol-deacylase isoform X2 [Aplysia californica]
MAAPIPLSVSVVLVSIIGAGIYDVLTNFEQNGCEMTYMYEYPEYQEIALGKLRKEYPTYRLFIYGEGNLKLDGIPVLFIPGNAGSYKQVRSLGSVSLRMSEHPQVRAHFNYFVVDFNEELSALYGGVLDKQTEFVHHCLKKILSFYSGAKSPPSSVVLVGHSMGGIIARALFTLPDFDSSMVNTIITQATPHQRPVAPVDIHLEKFYSKVNQYWRDNSLSSVRHVTIVSTGGGYRDIQVRYGLSALDGIVALDRAVSASTMAIPKAWVSTDHLCAVWCRQMVLLTKRALFDIVDEKTLQVSEDTEVRMKAFQHHFLNNNGLPDYQSYNENKTITLDSKIQWTYRDEKTWKFSVAKTTAPQYFSIPLVVEERSDSIIIQTNLTNPEWICYCDFPEGEQKCSTCTSLSSRSRFLPPLYSNTRYLRIAFKDIELTPRSHIVIIVPSGQRKVDIVSDRYNSDERHLVFQMPNIYDTIISYPVSATDGAAMLKISNGSAFYSLHLAGLSLPTNTYRALVMPMGCRRHNAEGFEGSILRLNIPWSKEESYVFSGYGKELSIPVKLQSGRPADYDWQLDASEPHLEMFLHPYCHYKLKLIVATQDTLGQAVRFYGVLLPGYLVAVLCLLLRGVVVAHGKGQVVSTREQSPADSLMEHAKPYYIMPTILVLNFLIRFGPVAKLLTKFGVPEDDAASLAAQSIWFKMLPLLMYLCCWMTSYMQAFVVFHTMSVVSFLGRLFAWLPDGLVRLISSGQLVLSVLAISSCLVCGSLGSFLVSSLLIFKVLRLMYIVSRQQDSKDTHRKLSLYFPIMLMVNLQALLSMGPFIIWAKNVAMTRAWFQPLESDPSRYPSLAVTVGVVLLLYAENATVSRSQSAVIGWVLYAMTAITLLYAMESLYRLPAYISICVLAVSLPYAASFLMQKLNGERRKNE